MRSSKLHDDKSKSELLEGTMSITSSVEIQTKGYIDGMFNFAFK